MAELIKVDPHLLRLPFEAAPRRRAPEHALTVLVALRFWRSHLHVWALLAVRSDSLGALMAMRRSASRAAGLNLVLQELALEEAELSVGFDSLTHVPGMSNVLPDALSRQWCDPPKAFTESLRSVTEAPVPLRTSGF